MSRSLVLGNGHILVCMNKHGLVRDFYFPYVGLENHVGGARVHKVGVWVDGSMSWLSDGSWDITVNYKRETMASEIKARNGDLGIEIDFTDLVYNEKNIFLRNLLVRNTKSGSRTVKVFFNQQFELAQSRHADTAYFNPDIHAIIHYKGRRVFLAGGRGTDGARFDEFSVGLFGIEGREGTWKDAEDGKLSENPIEHGSVDSTLGFTLSFDGVGSKQIVYWNTVGETFREAKVLQEYILSKTPEHLTETTQDFWKAWVNKSNFTFYGLSEKVIAQFKKSLFIIRTHCDAGGGILASGDSDNFQYGRDTYGYMWPRDGAFVALSMSKARYHDISKRFYAFCNDVITREGYILHKYQPDKSLGSSWHPWMVDGKPRLAIQEDETAILLYGLWEHYKASRDIEFIELLYNSLIKSAADFVAGYRDPKTKLPRPSYDLWEEKYGTSTFTASAAYGALRAAANFANVLGKEEDEAHYLAAAEEIKEAIIKYLYSDECRYFCKLSKIENDKPIHDATLDTSNFYGIFRFGVLDADDERLTRSYDVVKAELVDPIPMGGAARYKGDQYFKVSDEVPGNPWFVTTLWLTQYNIARATREEEVKAAAEDLNWVAERALPSGVLSEQLNPYSGEHLSVSPLTWSHAEFVTTVIEYLEKLEKLGVCQVCYPVIEH